LLHRVLSPPHEICRAFADDLGMVLASLSSLKKVSSLFKILAAVSGMTLNIAKTVLIPLGGELSQAVVDRIREFLTKNIPQWSAVKITTHAKYLGVYVGPGADEQQIWKEPAEKWSWRTRVLAGARLAPAFGIRQYNSRAITCMSYIGQLYPAPKNIIKHEKSLLQQLLHIGNNSLPPGHIFRLKDIGASQPISLVVHNLAARYRTAHRTIGESRIKENTDEYLAALNTDEAPLSALVKPFAKTAHWKLQPLVFLLNVALSSFEGKYPMIAGAVASVQAQDLEEDTNKLKSMQAIVYTCLLPVVHPANFPSELFRRLCCWLPEMSGYPQLKENIRDLLDTSAKCRNTFIMAIVKTFCNAWPTSFRRHEKLRPCVFGCPNGRDKLRHYLVCPRAWPEMCRAMNYTHCNRDVLARLGLSSAFSASEAIKVLTGLLEAFHTLWHSQSKHVQNHFLAARKRVELMDTKTSRNREHHLQPLGRNPPGQGGFSGQDYTKPPWPGGFLRAGRSQSCSHL